MGLPRYPCAIPRNCWLAHALDAEAEIPPARRLIVRPENRCFAPRPRHWLWPQTGRLNKICNKNKELCLKERDCTVSSNRGITELTKGEKSLGHRTNAGFHAGTFDAPRPIRRPEEAFRTRGLQRPMGWPPATAIWRAGNSCERISPAVLAIGCPRLFGRREGCRGGAGAALQGLRTMRFEREIAHAATFSLVEFSGCGRSKKSAGPRSMDRARATSRTRDCCLAGITPRSFQP